MSNVACQSIADKITLGGVVTGHNLHSTQATTPVMMQEHAAT